MSVLFIREVFDAAKGMIIHRKMFKKFAITRRKL
jgi:hypothetical protein